MGRGACDSQDATRAEHREVALRKGTLRVPGLPVDHAVGDPRLPLLDLDLRHDDRADVPRAPDVGAASTDGSLAPADAGATTMRAQDSQRAGPGRAEDGRGPIGPPRTPRGPPRRFGRTASASLCRARPGASTWPWSDFEQRRAPPRAPCPGTRRRRRRTAARGVPGTSPRRARPSPGPEGAPPSGRGRCARGAPRPRSARRRPCERARFVAGPRGESGPRPGRRVGTRPRPTRAGRPPSVGRHGPPSAVRKRPRCDTTPSRPLRAAVTQKTGGEENADGDPRPAAGRARSVISPTSEGCPPPCGWNTVASTTTACVGADSTSLDGGGFDGGGSGATLRSATTARRQRGVEHVEGRRARLERRQLGGRRAVQGRGGASTLSGVAPFRTSLGPRAHAPGVPAASARAASAIAAAAMSAAAASTSASVVGDPSESRIAARARVGHPHRPKHVCDMALPVWHADCADAMIRPSSRASTAPPDTPPSRHRCSVLGSRARSGRVRLNFRISSTTSSGGPLTHAHAAALEPVDDAAEEPRPQRRGARAEGLQRAGNVARQTARLAEPDGEQHVFGARADPKLLAAAVEQGFEPRDAAAPRPPAPDTGFRIWNLWLRFRRPGNPPVRAAGST